MEILMRVEIEKLGNSFSIVKLFAAVKLFFKRMDNI